MEEEIVVKEEATEDEVKEEVEIKQEVEMGDEEMAEEEVGNRWAVEDEVEGDLMIKREDGLTDPLGKESDVLEGTSGVQRSETIAALTRPTQGGPISHGGVKTSGPERGDPRLEVGERSPYYPPSLPPPS
ncbi:hypothetical protein GE061_008722 [Apolygus lucorum]|uniref:Uncharacterized protein n=1 Tax=Apolygus lucorum TaxID=248454 RepID=A0A8S9WPL9_APOLU|nr:hypothetical protein GE061_008722 [Apolygus lucorum]